MIDSLKDEIVRRYTFSGNLQLPTFIAAGESGNEIVEKITSKLRSNKQDVKIYSMNIGKKGKSFQEVIFDDVTNRSILICDSIVNTGSTLYNMRKFFLDKGAKDVKTLTVFLRNGAILIPNFYVSIIDKHEEVIFGIKRFPINFYQNGNIKLLTEEDCGKEINCPEPYINNYLDDYIYDQKVDSNYHSYIIEDAHGPAGILHIKNKGNKEVYVDTLAINKDKRNNNYGGSLMNFLEDHCRINNFLRATLHAHESKVGYFKRFGYKETGQHYNLPAYGNFVEMEMKYLFNV